VCSSTALLCFMPWTMAGCQGRKQAGFSSKCRTAHLIALSFLILPFCCLALRDPQKERHAETEAELARVVSVRVDGAAATFVPKGDPRLRRPFRLSILRRLGATAVGERPLSRSDHIVQEKEEPVVTIAREEVALSALVAEETVLTAVGEAVSTAMRFGPISTPRNLTHAESQQQAAVQHGRLLVARGGCTRPGQACGTLGWCVPSGRGGQWSGAGHSDRTEVVCLSLLNLADLPLMLTVVTAVVLCLVFFALFRECRSKKRGREVKELTLKARIEAATGLSSTRCQAVLEGLCEATGEEDVAIAAAHAWSARVDDNRGRCQTAGG